MKQDTIAITVVGPKKNRQIIVDLVYKTLFDPEFEISNPGLKTEIRFDSTLSPSEEAESEVMQ
jgi:hypothetical protein